MSGTNKTGNFVILCSGCGAEPFQPTDNAMPKSFGEVVGRKCSRCDHLLTGDDIRASMKVALDGLAGGRRHAKPRRPLR